MRVLGTAEVLTQAEIEMIVNDAFRIMEEIGARVPNERVLSTMAEHGVKIDSENEMAYFPRKIIEKFLEETKKFSNDVRSDQTGGYRESVSPWRSLEGGNDLAFQTGAYPQYYADPRTGKVQEHTRKTVIEMTQLADSLKNATFIFDGMGVPSDVPGHLMPLHLRLIGWKYSQKTWCGKIELTSLLPYVLEMCEVMANAQGRPVADYVQHDWQMISPLQFGKEELIQYLYLLDRGFPSFGGQILSSGGTSPATLAGTMSLQLAEQLILNFMARIFVGLHVLHMGNSATVLDLKVGVFQYGRPELGLTHLAYGQIARYFGATFGANSFLGDGKVPSCEVGMQKAINSIPAIMAGSRSLGTTGLLSVDEIGSPIQLIIDNEYAEVLRRFARGFEVNEDTLAFDVIKEVGPGGNFMGEMHTVKHFRQEHWQPTIFSREMYNGWMSGDQKTDVDRALDLYETVMAEPPKVYMDDDTEKALLKVIEKAEKELG